MTVMAGCTAETTPWTVWIADLEGRVVALDGRTGAPMPDPVEAEGIRAAAVVPVGDDVVVADFETGELHRLGTGESLIWQNPPSGLRLEEPCDLAVTPDGTLWALGNDTENILGLTAARLARSTGAARELGGHDAPIPRAHGLTATPDGELWVALSRTWVGQPILERWNPLSGERVATLDVPELDAATDVTLSGGVLWVADWSSGQLMRLDPLTGRQLPAATTTLDRPLSLAPVPGGGVVVLTEEEGLFVVSASGVVDRLAPAPEGSTPRGVTVVALGG